MAIIPYLLYEDVAGAMAFLERAFGFLPVGAAERAPDGRVRHAAMQLGDDLVMMGWPGPEYRSPKRLGAVTLQLYVMVEDVDAHFRRAAESGATILEPPSETAYGHRRYGAEDLEGHAWYFASEGAGASTG